MRAKRSLANPKNKNTQLAFKKYDIITLTKEEPLVNTKDGKTTKWWSGSLHGKEGYVLDRLVEKISSGIQSIQLAECEITDLSAMGDGLTDNIALKDLYLHKNQIVDIRSLASARGLHTLDLSYNQIVDIYPLGLLLKKEDCALRDLELNDNAIGPHREFAECLALNTTLTTLVIGSNKISDTDLEESGLGDAIRQHPGLTYVDMEGNPLSQERVKLVRQIGLDKKIDQKDFEINI